MGKYIRLCTIIITIIISPFDLISQWVTITSGTVTNLHSIDFPNVNVGWIAGDSGLVRKTMNGAGTWTTQFTNTQYTLRNIYAANTNNVIISGDNGVIIRTTNGGTNWNTVSPLFILQSGNPPNYFDIDFLNSTTGTTIGQTRYYATTTNGGANWLTGILNTAGQANLDYRAIDMIDNLNTFIASSDFQLAGQWNSYIQKSTNNGTSFNIVKTVNSSIRCAFTDIEFVNLSTGYAANQNGKLYRTTNSGITWDSVSLGFIPNSIEFSSLTTGFICGNGGYLAKSTDGGISWIQQTTPVNSNLNANHAYNDLTVYAVGSNGTLLKTVDGGSYVGITLSGNETPAEFSLSQNYPNPFNPVTNISFDIPNASNVELALFNVLGIEVRVIASEYLTAGKYGVNLNASDLPSGTYFYRLKAGEFSETKKMILIK